jgi:hypothetical protein
MAKLRTHSRHAKPRSSHKDVETEGDMVSLKRLKLGERGNKLLYLMAIDGLAVSAARRLIERENFSSIGDFAASWFLHLFAVALFAVFASAFVYAWPKILAGRRGWRRPV